MLQEVSTTNSLKKFLLCNSAEDRKEYLESLLRESKKEEDAPVLDDDALNDLIARRLILFCIVFYTE